MFRVSIALFYYDLSNSGDDCWFVFNMLLSFWNYEFQFFLPTFLVPWRFFKAWHSLNQSNILAAYYNNSWDFILSFRWVTTLKNERKVFLGPKVVIRRYKKNINLSMVFSVKIPIFCTMLLLHNLHSDNLSCVIDI